ncbi:GGDEF domain-containing protein [Marinobacterium sediminicola]|nr:GGDEF domain-containing protein [Marinobacterium sediminicola]ULG69543.1 GGDEF domain-containing protein [Marinobacterium sediminicola]
MTDLLAAGRHSRYFNHTRSYHLFTRVRMIAWLLMVLQSAWILIDWWLLPADVSTTIAYARLASSCSCLLLGLWASQPYRLEVSLIRLLLLVMVLTLFQTGSTLILENQGYQTSVAGYAFFPFMIITMLAIFPLTVFEILGFTLFVVLVELVTQLWLSSFGQVTAVNDLWLLALLGCIAGWASVNQLNLLLVLYRQATRDPLTGLANRRQVMEQLDEDIKDAHSQGRPLAVMMFDLDKFKGFNDQYGHAAGDIVLKQFARILRQQSRSKDELPGRFGGEEFLLILPGVDADQARERAEAIRAACHQTSLQVPTGDEVSFTTSIGIAMLQGGEDHSSLLQRADEALYCAKDGGRDRHCMAELEQAA